MEPETDLDPELLGALERHWQLFASILDQVSTAKIERNSDIPLVASRAKRALASARLKQATPTNDLVRASKQVVITLDKSCKLIADGIAALFDVLLAIIARDAEKAAQDARQAVKSSTENGRGVPSEAARFVTEMIARGVVPSMFDVLTKEELDVIARLFWEKNDDYKHRVNEGVWVALFRGGYFDFPVMGLTADEAIAVQLALGGDTEEGLMAKQFLEQMSGRPLGVSPVFALATVRAFQAAEKSRGLRLTGEQINVDGIQDDIAFIFETLGLGDDDRNRANEVWRRLYAPRAVEFDQQRAAEQDAQRHREDQYMDLARERRRRRSEASDRHAAQRPPTDSEPADAHTHHDPQPPTGNDDAAAAVSESHWHLDPETQATKTHRERVMDADRQVYQAAIAYADDLEVREFAGVIANNPRLRAKWRKRGIDVSEPLAAGEMRQEGSGEAGTDAATPTSHTDFSGPVTAGLTRAEVANMLKGKK